MTWSAQGKDSQAFGGSRILINWLMCRCLRTVWSSVWPDNILQVLWHAERTTLGVEGVDIWEKLGAEFAFDGVAG